MTTNRKADIKVSVIIPVFNAEKYLERCLDSILGQTYKNIEVLVVDDGSSDSSKEILKQYKKNDSRIVYSSQNHLGPNIARAKAIKKATGDYAIFVDADDYIAKNAIEVLVGNVKKYRVDAIRYNAKYDINHKVVAPILKTGESDKILNHNEILPILLTTYKLNSLWMQLYDMNTLKEAKAFNNSVAYGEDFLVNLEIHQKTKKMLIIDDVLYFYCENPNSTTKSVKPEQITKNVKERIYVSSIAIKTALRFESDLRNKTIYCQLKMIRDAMLRVNRINNYKKRDFVNMINNILPREYFLEINQAEFKSFLSGLSFADKVKNKRIVLAIINADYEYIWHYNKIWSIFGKLCFWRTR